MGFLDRLFGTEQEAPPAPRRAAARQETLSDDERAVERYRYLLRTAPPETIEQVHAEAFAKLSDEQRVIIYEELSRGAGTGERPLSSEPATLARAATRAEMRTPGALERSFGPNGSAFGGEPQGDASRNGSAPQAGSAQQAGSPQQARGGMGFGGMIGASLLGTVAGYVVGSALVSAFLPWDAGSTDASGADGGSEGGGDAQGDTAAADAGGADAGGMDAGGDAGGFGDFGGGFGGDFGF